MVKIFINKLKLKMPKTLVLVCVCAIPVQFRSQNPPVSNVFDQHVIALEAITPQQ